MYSPSFIASKVASAQEAAAAGRYDIAERKFAAVTSFVSFNVAVSRASAGDFTGTQKLFCFVNKHVLRVFVTRRTTGAIDQLSLNITDGHVLPLILRGVCLSQAS
jgi:hypothetical protein